MFFSSTKKFKFSFSKGGHWIEVDLKKNEEIVSIATQGMARKNDNDRFVNSYHVQYQVDGESTYEYVTDDNEKKIVSFLQ